MSPYLHPLETFERPLAELPAPPSWGERHVWPLVLGVCAIVWCGLVWIIWRFL